jgi:hypothetical protein
MIRALSNAPVHLLDFDVGDRGLCGLACATTSGAHPRLGFSEPISGSAARRQLGSAEEKKKYFAQGTWSSSRGRSRDVSMGGHGQAR